MKNSLKFS